MIRVIYPPRGTGIHCMGASFGPGDLGTDEREAEHAHNVEMMCTALPELDLTAPAGRLAWTDRAPLQQQ